MQFVIPIQYDKDKILKLLFVQLVNLPEAPTPAVNKLPFCYVLKKIKKEERLCT